MFEGKDKKIEEEIARLKTIINVARATIDANDTRVDTLELYPNHEAEVERLNEESNCHEKSKLEAEKTLNAIAPLQIKLEDAKKRFEDYKDLIDFAEIRTEIEELQDNILETLKRN